MYEPNRYRTNTPNRERKKNSVANVYFGLVWPFALIDFTAVALELLDEFCVSFDVLNCALQYHKIKGYKGKLSVWLYFKTRTVRRGIRCITYTRECMKACENSTKKKLSTHFACITRSCGDMNKRLWARSKNALKLMVENERNLNNHRGQLNAE